jgi:hypothetical protein
LDVGLAVQAVARGRTLWLKKVKSSLPGTQSSYSDARLLGEFSNSYLHVRILRNLYMECKSLYTLRSRNLHFEPQYLTLSLVKLKSLNLA